MALHAAQCKVELREVVLRDKPQAFLDVSPSATVPCLVHANGVIDESIDIMRWALKQNDPHGWLDMPPDAIDWISRTDGPFKYALDRTKYTSRYPNDDTTQHHANACTFLGDLDRKLDLWLFDKPSLADFAIVPFVRQFAFIDKPWFDAQPWPNVHEWLSNLLNGPTFSASMQKYPQWRPLDGPVFFPDPML
ncbi:Glutathione S-transferase-like [Sulfitobacter guttiformis KCTC 32187]|nr:Glutathione S-transferase-like [Sulfitobacter guttiformis KCTC 32187]